MLAHHADSFSPGAARSHDATKGLQTVVGPRLDGARRDAEPLGGLGHLLPRQYSSTRTLRCSGDSWSMAPRTAMLSTTSSGRSGATVGLAGCSRTSVGLAERARARSTTMLRATVSNHPRTEPWPLTSTSGCFQARRQRLLDDVLSLGPVVGQAGGISEQATSVLVVERRY